MNTFRESQGVSLHILVGLLVILEVLIEINMS